MYKFSNDVSIKEYELFLKKYSGVPITQDYRWAKVKDNWDNTICGLYKDDELIAATLLLIKVLPLGIKMIYSPRGYLIDYTNKKYLEEFTKGIKEYAKKIKAFMIKIDPLIAVNEECLDGKKEYPINFSVDYKEKINDLLENKYIHKGYEKTMNAYIQPRFNMMVPLIDKENKSLSKEEVLKSLKGKNKNQVGDYHIKRGCIFTSSSDMKDIDSFYELICHTEKRQSINLRDKEYFIRMMESYGDRAKIFFGKLDLDKYLQFIEEEHHNDLEYLNNKRDLINNLKKEKGSVINICTALVVFPSNKDGIRVMEYLYAGSNTENFSNLNIPVGLVSNILEVGIENNCDYCNLGGVEGNLNDHLTTFKSKFNPVVIEYVGEFDLIINKLYYFMFEKLLPRIKKIIKIVKR